MFEFIRSHQRWMQFILLLLIVPSFLLVGIQGYDSFMHKTPNVATVADEPLTRAEFDQAHLRLLDQYRQTMGAQFDSATVDTPALRKGLLEQLIDQRLVAQVAIDDHFSVSNERLSATIASLPEMQEQGQFSPNRYLQVLAAQGLTPSAFEASLRRNMALASVLQPITLSAYVPETVKTTLQAALTQIRTIRTKAFVPADYPTKMKFTQASLQEWYDANKQQLEIPEQATIQYLVLDQAAAARDIPQPSDADLQAYYEQNKNRFIEPAQYMISHIMINMPADATDEQRKAAHTQADTLAKEAQADPEQFAELAKKYSQDLGSAAEGGNLGWGWSNVTEMKPWLPVVSGLQKGQVSAVLESSSGLHIVKLTDVIEAKNQSFDAVKDTLTKEVKEQLAAKQFSDMANKLSKQVYDNDDSLQPAADAAGLKLRTASGIMRDGLAAALQAGPDAAAAGQDAALLNNPRVRQTVFSPEVLRDKKNSGVIELSSDTLLALRVVKLAPKYVPSLEQAHDTVAGKLAQQGERMAALRAGQEALAALQAQPTGAAAEQGFSEPVQLSRIEPNSAPHLSSFFINEVMRLSAGKLPAYAGIQEGDNYTIVRIEAIKPGKMSDAQSAQLANQLSGLWGQAESEAVLRMLREKYKVKLLPEADEAIKGDDPTAG